MIQTNLLSYLAVAVGGGLGAMLRYHIGLLSQQYYSSHNFPMATLAVNILGSFGFGVLFYLIVEKQVLSEYWRLICLVGFMGGLTTFSTYSFESMQLIFKGDLLLAFTSIIANVVLSLIAVMSAYWLSKLVFS